ADARARVYVDGHAETPGLARDVAEEKILKRLVLSRRGRSAAREACVDARGVGLARVGEVERAQVRGLELDCDRAVSLLPFERRRDDARRVLSKRRWHCRQLQFREVALQQR